MSTVLKEQFDAIIAQAEIEDAALAKRENAHIALAPSPIFRDVFKRIKKYPDTESGFNSAMAEINGWYGDLNLVEAASPTIEPLARNGCAFIRWGYFFLYYLGCPAECRDWAICICALTGGNSKEPCIITGHQIETLMGYSAKTVRDKREMFLAWQQESNWGVIDYYEGARDGETKKYIPSRYQANLISYIVAFIEAAKQHPAFARQPEKILTDEHSASGRALSAKIAEGFTGAQLVRRKEARGHERAPKQPEDVQVLDRCIWTIKNSLQSARKAGKDYHNTATYLHDCIDQEVKKMEARATYNG